MSDNARTKRMIEIVDERDSLKKLLRRCKAHLECVVECEADMWEPEDIEDIKDILKGIK